MTATETSTLERTGRIVDALTLILSVPAMFSSGYVRPSLVVPGDATATAGNIIHIRGRGTADSPVLVLAPPASHRRSQYDVIFDAVGKTSSSKCRRALTPDGTYVTVTRGMARPSTEDLIFLRELIEAGKVKSAIDRRHPLEGVAEAHRYVATGHKVGNIVITLEHHRTP